MVEYIAPDSAAFGMFRRPAIRRQERVIIAPVQFPSSDDAPRKDPWSQHRRRQTMRYGVPRRPPGWSDAAADSGFLRRMNRTLGGSLIRNVTSRGTSTSGTIALAVSNVIGLYMTCAWTTDGTSFASWSTPPRTVTAIDPGMSTNSNCGGSASTTIGIFAIFRSPGASTSTRTSIFGGLGTETKLARE